MKPKSIFDTWKHKAIGTRETHDGKRCVLGHMDYYYSNHTEKYEERHTTEHRLAAFIRENYKPRIDPFNQLGLNWSELSDICVLVAANNTYDELTPERWREIDLITKEGAL